MGCKQGQIESTVRPELWNIEWAPESLCKPDSPVWELGIWRKVSCRKTPEPRPDSCDTDDTYEEFVSICSKEIKLYKAAHVDNIEDWLAKAKKGAR